MGKGIMDTSIERIHAKIAFPAASRSEVDESYQTALTAGGRHNGAPGIRRYHPNYYAAFVFDPEWNNVEPVCCRG
jgi:hypothetical protein